MQPLPKELAPRLVAWYAENRRDLPWRQDREPYHVWLSEIMLQQTRVEAVKGYYARFLAELPDIASLAQCAPDRLTKLWEGLGYYSRVRNLQKAAQVIVNDHGGRFPEDYDAIRALPGIGDYTAGAIASICFELPTPAVDGNVLRVLARVQADSAPVTKQAVKRAYADALRPVYKEHPGLHGTLRAERRAGVRKLPAGGALRGKARRHVGEIPCQGGKKGAQDRGKDGVFPRLRRKIRRAPAAGVRAACRAVGAAECRRSSGRGGGAGNFAVAGVRACGSAQKRRANARIHARRMADAVLLRAGFDVRR